MERMSFAKRREPVTFVRSPIIRKLPSGRMVSASWPLSLVSNTFFPIEPKNEALHLLMQINPIYQLAEASRGLIVLGVTGGIAAYKAVEISRRLVDAGAHVLDVGGESTRPPATKDHTAWPVCASSAPVGSSQNITRGFLARARAMATRCC